MKSVFVLAIAGFFATVSAQNLSDLPSCALTCLTAGLAATKCSITDLKCACSDTTFVSGSATCIKSSCPEADQQKALAGAGAICSSVGVTIPTTFPVSSSAAATVSTTTTSPVGVSTTTATTATVSGTVSTVSGSTASSSPLSVPSTTATTLTASTTASTTTGGGNLTQTVSLPVQSTNAAHRLDGMNVLSVVGLGVIGYLAL